MKWLVLNAVDAAVYRPVEPYSVLISITGRDETPVCFLYLAEYCAVLRLAFDDVETDNSRYKGFTREQARQTLEFLRAHAGCGELVAHCGAGISRSAAVVKAWLYMQGDNSGIDALYRMGKMPNARVFNMLRELIDRERYNNPGL